MLFPLTFWLNYHWIQLDFTSKLFLKLDFENCKLFVCFFRCAHAKVDLSKRSKTETWKKSRSFTQIGTPPVDSANDLERLNWLFASLLRNVTFKVRKSRFWILIDLGVLLF